MQAGTWLTSYSSYALLMVMNVLSVGIPCTVGTSHNQLSDHMYEIFTIITLTNMVKLLNTFMTAKYSQIINIPREKPMMLIRLSQCMASQLLELKVVIM